MSANRQQRRQISKNMGLKPGERLTLSAIMVQFDNGKALYLDTEMVQIIDKETQEPLFQEVLEPVGDVNLPTSVTEQQTPAKEFPDEPTAAYSVAFDTPEGRMVYVKDGNWSGVRAAREGE